MLMNQFYILIACFFISFHISGQEIARGTVFHDHNRNQILDPNEEGIAGVRVSNGVDVVITDKKGQYELAIEGDAVIFIVKPKDWMTPVDKNNLPQFHYVHKPQGSPENFKYKGSQPTGPLPDEINFPLFREGGATNFKMVVFGDPQPYSITQVDYVAEDIVQELLDRQDLKFGMTLGDIVGDDLELFSPLNEAVAQIGIPWYNVLGNHDMNFDALDDLLSDETYERVFGPTTYAFVYGDVHFIVVDDVIHMNDGIDRTYVGGLRPDQLKFVENYLSTISKDDLIVLTMHIPLAMHGDYFRQSDQKKLFDLLKAFPYTLSISAHTHIQENKFFNQDSTDWQRAIPHHHFNVGTTSGSWWNGMNDENNIPHTMMRDGTPNGYSIIRFNGTDYVIDWKVAGSPEDHQMNIYLPRGIAAGSADSCLLTVNFFMGSEQSQLHYRIRGLTDWLPMNKIEKIDPYYQILKDRWNNFEKLGLMDQWESDSTLAQLPPPGTNIPRPRPSSHIWESEIGTDWPTGRHVVEIRARDRYGRTFYETQMMRVTAD